MLRKYKRCPIGRLKGKSGYCIVSHRTGRVLSCYKTMKLGQRALNRLARFRK